MRIPKQFLGAFKRGHRETSKEFIDEGLSYELLKRVLDSDYGDEEALEALNFLTKFNNEFHKNVVKKGDPTALHKTEAQRRECYARENARNRDLMSVRRHLRVQMDVTVLESVKLRDDLILETREDEEAYLSAKDRRLIIKI